MGFFSGLIALANYLLVLVFVFVVGGVSGMILINWLIKEYCPKADMLIRAELLHQQEKKDSKVAQQETDDEGDIWTE